MDLLHLALVCSLPLSNYWVNLAITFAEDPVEIPIDGQFSV